MLVLPFLIIKLIVPNKSFEILSKFRLTPKKVKLHCFKLLLTKVDSIDSKSFFCTSAGMICVSTL